MCRLFPLALLLYLLTLGALTAQPTQDSSQKKVDPSENGALKSPPSLDEVEDIADPKEAKATSKSQPSEGPEDLKKETDAQRKERGVKSEPSSRASKPAQTLNTQEVSAMFSRGKNAYLYGTYPLVIESLQPLISPNLLISNPDDLAHAYEYLGLAYFYLNNKKRAQKTFKNLIFFRPEYELDPVQVPPTAVTFFTQLKKSLASELATRQAMLDEHRTRELTKERTLKSREVILERQVNSRLLALFPFGVGQFQNQDTKMGYTFLISELIATGLSIGFFFGVESLRQPNGTFSIEEISNAQRLQSAQMISGSIAIGLMVSGVIHAFIFFQEDRFLRRLERALPRGERRLSTSPSPQLLDSISLEGRPTRGGGASLFSFSVSF
jgi:hypothetical protein